MPAAKTLKFIIHLAQGGAQAQAALLSVPSESWIAGWQALVAIEPPVAGLSPLECLGAVGLWCDFAAQAETPAGRAEAVQAVRELGAAHFAGAAYDIFQVEERCRKAIERTWPLGEPSPGFVWFTFMRRLPEISHAEFVIRWWDGHWPLVRVHHPGLWGYTQNAVRASLGPDAPRWDGIGELQFKTAADMRDRMYDSEAGKQKIWDDIAGFLDTTAGRRFYAQEIWLKHPGDAARQL